MVIKEGEIYHIKENRRIGLIWKNSKFVPKLVRYEYICKIGKRTTGHTGKNRKQRRHEVFILQNIINNKHSHEMSTVDLWDVDYYKKLNGTGIEVLYEQKSGY